MHAQRGAREVRSAGGGRTRRRASRAVLWMTAFALPMTVGCSLSGNDSSGCGSPPRATDIAATGVILVGTTVPCSYGTEAVRGSEPHLWVNYECPGESDAFLIAVRVDGKHFNVREGRCFGYGTSGSVDVGPWEAPDTLWHTVDVVFDPLNLFHEANEQNNRVSGQVRIVEPDVGLLDLLTGFRLTEEAGNQSGLPVSQVAVGTPVYVRVGLAVHGRYDSLHVSMALPGQFDTTLTRSYPDCGSLSAGPPWEQRRWVPVTPGTYDVTFRVEPPPGAVDRVPTDNVAVRRLTVTATAASAAR